MSFAWPIFLLFVFFDTTQLITQAAIRASGHLMWGAIITALSYWLLGIPTAYFLALRGSFGIRGIWLGPTIAVTFNTIAYTIIFWCLDWDKLMKEAKKKRLEDNKHHNEAIK